MKLVFLLFGKNHIILYIVEYQEIIQAINKFIDFYFIFEITTPTMYFFQCQMTIVKIQI
jgi:hypothetical protein